MHWTRKRCWLRGVAVLSLSVQQSTFEHPDCNLAVFAGQPFGKGEPIGFYYGSLYYYDL